MEIQFWTHQKRAVFFNISLILSINLIGVGVTIAFWNELDWLFKTTLIVSSVLAFIYLSMYVMRIELKQKILDLVLPHKRISLQYFQVDSIRVNKRMGKTTLLFRLNKPVGFRRNISFSVDKNEERAIEAINFLRKRGCRIYTNPNLDTKIFFNKSSDQFELKQ
jgi:hypothetical protein